MTHTPKKFDLNYPIPFEVSRVTKTLRDAGFEAYLVGGCVRDMVVGTKPKDWDATTNATPEQIQALFPGSFYENDYGTVGIVSETEDETLKVIEVTPYRTEGSTQTSVARTLYRFMGNFLTISSAVISQ